MSFIRNRLYRLGDVLFWRWYQLTRPRGQTLVEYGLLLALIAIIVIVALLFLGPMVSQIFRNIAKNLQK
jgi:pilus assembly protein Flp/PilA